MQSFENRNPITVAVYFLAVAGISMFCMNPFILSLSLIGAAAFFVQRNKTKHVKSHFYFFLLFIVLSAINPLFYHNGVTVLFVVNNSPVTLEALIYGIAAAAMILSAVYWFRSFSQIMTSDKLLYILGKFWPKLSLVLSMALRYVPLFSRQDKKINAAQTALGLYKDDNIADRIKGSAGVFSVLITWAVEKGIITADSMTARGYGTHKRTHFALFGFKPKDILLLLITALLSSAVILSLSVNALDISYYPKTELGEFTAATYVGIICYGILALLPVIINITETVKWNCLKSKI